jgi:hypothetical protein
VYVYKCIVGASLLSTDTTTPILEHHFRFVALVQLKPIDLRDALSIILNIAETPNSSRCEA